MDQNGFESITRADFKLLVAQSSVVGSLWDAITSRPIQYRLRGVVVNARNILIKNGVPAEILKMTADLQARHDEIQTKLAHDASDNKA